MNKIILFLSFIFVSSLAFASFPVKKNKISESSTELIIEAESFADELLPSSGVVFNFGTFMAGLLLGLIGVGLVHIFSTDSDAKKSSWYGFGSWIILLIVLSAGAA